MDEFFWIDRKGIIFPAVFHSYTCSELWNWSINETLRHGYIRASNDVCGYIYIEYWREPTVLQKRTMKRLCNKWECDLKFDPWEADPSDEEVFDLD